MNFLKKHYEKLLLSLVLLGLAAATALMPIKVSQEKQKEEDRKQTLINPKVTERPFTDVSTNQATLQRLATPVAFDLSGKHNLFNPVRWQKRPDGSLLKIDTTLYVSPPKESESFTRKFF